MSKKENLRYVLSHITNKRCNRCGCPVLKSDVEGYTYQCLNCDEDLYKMEVYPGGKPTKGEITQLVKFHKKAEDTGFDKYAGCKKLISDFCKSEYDGEADFADLNKVPIAYTTDEEDNFDIQVYINLPKHRLETYLNNKLAEVYVMREGIEDFEYDLAESLDFDSLIYVSDKAIKKPICKVPVRKIAKNGKKGSRAYVR